MWAGTVLLVTGEGSVSAVVLYAVVVGAPCLGFAVAWLAGTGLFAIAVVGAVAATVLLAAGGLGYPNANAALAVQIAGLLGVVLVRRGTRRLLVAGVLLVPLAFTVVNLSQAGFVTGLGVIAAVAIHRRSRRAVATATGLGIALLVAVVAWQIAAATARLEPPPVVVRALSSVRFDLWSEAWELIAARPVTGHGPGAFSVLSPTAAGDADLRPAHSAPLEFGAELGVVGVSILLVLVAVGFAVVVRMPSSGSIVAVATWTALWLHSMVDYVADFPVVLFVAGLVLGSATAPLPQAPGARTAPHR